MNEKLNHVNRVKLIKKSREWWNESIIREKRKMAERKKVYVSVMEMKWGWRKCKEMLMN